MDQRLLDMIASPTVFHLSAALTGVSPVASSNCLAVRPVVSLTLCIRLSQSTSCVDTATPERVVNSVLADCTSDEDQPISRASSAAHCSTAAALLARLR